MKVYKILHIPTGLYVRNYNNIRMCSLDEYGSYFTNSDKNYDNSYEELIPIIVDKLNVLNIREPFQIAEFIEIPLTFDRNEFRFL